MSEFSASFHLQSSDVADAVELLRAARVPGYVFSPNERWVPFLFSAGAGIGSTETFDRVVEANHGLLLSYEYAEDHGCWVQVYRGPTRIARLKATFESRGAKFDRAEFVRLGLLSTLDADEVGRWVANAHRWDKRSNESDYLVAERLGLPRYQWFAYRYAADGNESCIEVDARGNVIAPGPAPPTDIDELLDSLPPTRKSAAALLAEGHATKALKKPPATTTRKRRR